MWGAGKVKSSENEVCRTKAGGEDSGQPHSWRGVELCPKVCSSRFEPSGSGSVWDAPTFCQQWSPFSSACFF